MKQTVLLGMDEATANKFGNYLQSNSEFLRVLPQSIPIFHNLKQALYQYSPNIVYLSLSRMRYDHTRNTDIEDEILNGIYEIKKDKDLSKIRIAVQTNQRTSSEFLRKLAMLRVSDIFLSQGQAGQMDRVAPQLSRPPTIENIKQYLSGSAPNIRLTDTDSDDENIQQYKDRVKQLERLLRVANSQITVYRGKRDNQLRTVPKSDYEELLRQVRRITNSRLTDEKTKALFAEVLNSKEADAKKISHLSKIVEAQNEQLMDLNDQVEKTENQTPRIDHVSKPEINYEPDSNYYEEPKNIPEPSITSARSVKKPLPQSTPTNRSRGRKENQKYNHNSSFDIAKIIKWSMLVVFCLFLIFGVASVFKMTNSGSTQTTKQSTPSYSSLIKKGKYVEAAKLYTDKGVQAENVMLSDPDIKDKGKIASGIAQYNDSDAIKFDNCYFNQEYATAASIYNQSNDTNLTNLIKARRIMVSYALMKDGQIAKAKSVAEPLNNSNLNERIKVYGQFYHANQILEAKIKHGHLSNEQISKAKKQIDENQDAMDKL